MRQDSNSQPSDYESLPLTTRPGLPPAIPIETVFTLKFHLQVSSASRKKISSLHSRVHYNTEGRF